jgi:amino acid adenylation domain-containing protein
MGQRPEGAPLPLSTAQAGMWLRHQLDPTGRAGNLAEYLEVHGPVDAVLLDKAWQEVSAEIDACRVRFVLDGDTPVQVVGPADGCLPVVDLSNDAPAAAEAWMRADLARPVDLARAPVTVALLKLAGDRFLWYHRYHHIAIDYYGIVLGTRRLAEVYTALASGAPVRPSGYGRLRPFLDELSGYRRSPDFARDRRYWLDLLADRPEPPELWCRPDPDGTGALRRTTFLPEAPLRGVADRAGTGWSRVVMAVAAGYLSRLTGQRSILLGLPVACRTTPIARHTPALAANVVPLRVEVDPAASTLALVGQVADAVGGALAHQRYRYEDLHRDLGLAGGDRGFLGWVVNAMSFDGDLDFAGQRVTRHNLANGPVEDLSLFAFRRSGERGVQVDLNADPRRWRAGDLAAHERGFLDLLRAALAHPERPIGRLDAPLRPIRGVPAAPATTLPALFERQVADTPDATALVYEGTTVTYAELNARANRLAHDLIDAGIGPGQVVALTCARSVELVAGLLGVVKAGAAYLPVDPGYPPERIAFMLRDARPARVLTAEAVAGAAGAERNPTRPVPARSAAYVIYTSGSTGTPNGVVVGHGGLASLAAAQIERFAITRDSRILQFASPGFDAAVAEFVTAFAAGAALVLAPAERLLPGAPLRDLVAAAGVTHVTIPPTVLAAVPPDGLPGVRTLVVAGEPCPPELVARWAGTRRMVNAYGPTEATVCATMSGPLSPDGGAPPIGRPIAGTRAYVLDALRNPVPVGVVGQLYLGGAGLAHGYLNRPALTAERFVEHPALGRLYRTGDLVSERPDGDLDFAGRADDQVKLRGYRVEPGEVEAVLTRHEAVTRAAVVVREDRPGDRRLVAYVVADAEPDADIEPGEVRRFAQRWLPDHLVPSSVVVLDRLPVTANGKLDRRALPRPASAGTGRAPRDGLEALLCRQFADVLGLADVGPDDDFFALGGHSLLAARLVERLRTVLPGGLSIRTLFAAPTVAALTERLADPDPVLSIRSGGTRPALFCLPPAAGSSRCYLGLRGHLDADRPIYGLPLITDGSGIEELATDYAGGIRAIQPTGPYHLLGWSFGGHLAHAVATVLQDAGCRVGLLAVLDAYPHDPRVPVDSRPEFATVERLVAGHAWRRYHGDLLVFVAGRDRTAASWVPYVGGHIEEHEIDCGHFEMTDPEPLAAIGRVVADRLGGVEPC